MLNDKESRPDNHEPVTTSGFQGLLYVKYSPRARSKQSWKGLEGLKTELDRFLRGDNGN